MPMRHLAFVFLLSLPALTAAHAEPAVYPVSNPPEIQRAVAAQAAEYLGSPYQYGGNGPAGFDCSGLVCRVYRDVLQAPLPRKTGTLAQQGVPVEPSQLQPGDLVFFNTTGSGISHAAVYEGDGMIIHAASQGPATGVIRSSLASKYYKNRFVRARRIILAADQPSQPSPGDRPAPGSDPADALVRKTRGTWEGDKGIDRVILRGDGTGYALMAGSRQIRMQLRILPGREKGTLRAEQDEPNRIGFYPGISSRQASEALVNEARPMVWILQLSRDGEDLVLKGIKETSYISSDGFGGFNVDNQYSRLALWRRLSPRIP